MAFYEEFSKYYDSIFPMGEEQLRFLTKWIEEDNNILDIACGTGNYATALAQRGCNAYAVDLDSKMVEITRNKATEQGVIVQASEGDMTCLEKNFNPQFFDMAFCIGNSLVHITDLEEMQEALLQMYNLLKEEGTLILQIINYDRILKYDIDGLPTIEDKEKGVKFLRRYVYEEGKQLIYFNTELIVNRDGEEEVYKNSVPLYPLKSEQLEGMLRKVGFKEINLYGSFKEEPYSQESYATIVVARA